MLGVPIKTICICLVYMLIGPGLILLNKYILTSLQFPYPMFLSGLGVLVSFFAAKLCVSLKYITLQRKEEVEGMNWYKRVLPVGLAHALTLAFGNTVYLLLNVGFIQMLKSFTPVIIMITGYLARIESPSHAVMFSVIIISMGTATTCSYTPQLSILGLLVMFISELTEALRLVLTQFLLHDLKMGVIEGLYVLAPASALGLFFSSAVLEFPTMYKNDAIMVILENPLTFVLASCMGLGVNFLSYYVIQATSSLTMKVLGTLRNIITILFGVTLYGETITANEGLGYGVALLGFCSYNAAKGGFFDKCSIFGSTTAASLDISSKQEVKHSPYYKGMKSNSDDVESNLPLLAQSSSLALKNPNPLLPQASLLELSTTTPRKSRSELN